jgi:hypothetical protein
MGIRSSLLLVAAAVFALATAVFSTAVMAAQSAPVTGAIFTTDQNSTFVNGNVYDTATDVYLNGGPRPNAPCTAAGLPNGDYYFQVTDPSGKVLLSYEFVDGANHPIVAISQRKVNVSGGFMKSYSGTRYTGIGKCSGAITVELFPYLRTPNPGGEYKVWMTPVGDYACGVSVSNQNDCTVGFFGFIPSKSKTDNFKVIDYDGDLTPDSEDACPDGNYPSNAPRCVVPQTVSIAAPFPAVDETQTGQFTITLSQAPASDLTVSYDIGGTAVNGTDYSTLSSSVLIPAGQTTATIAVMALDNGIMNVNEFVTLTLTGTSNPAYTVDSSSSTATVTIIDGFNAG